MTWTAFRHASALAACGDSRCGDSMRANYLPGALAEIERLRSALERMARDGCGCSYTVPDENTERGTKRATCIELDDDSETWCWSCQARAALRAETQGEG